MPNFTYKPFGYVTHLQAANPPAILGLRGKRIPPRNKAHLYIYLRELGLPIFATIFITETFGNLVVFINTAGTDQKLLRLLRRLLKGVKLGIR
jgi:hypothetical protein